MRFAQGNVAVQRKLFNPRLFLLVPAAVLVAGCGGSFTLASSGAGQLVLRSQMAGAATSEATSRATLATQATLHWTATTADGLPVAVQWSVTGGDPHSGAGSVSAEGVYTAPAWLTVDDATVTLHARVTGAATDAATAQIQITPGFIRPISPENLAVAPGAAVSLSASLAEVGGNASIGFALPAADTGTLSAVDCQRSPLTSQTPAYTVCSVTYTAPATAPAAVAVPLRATIRMPGMASGLAAGSAAGASSVASLLLSPAGITSNPAVHQQSLALPVPLGSSAGSNSDYDASGGQLMDCCGGTLGALVEDAGGNRYVLGNNHIFARSDQAIPGESMIQPALIDNGCTPYGEGPGTTPVASLVAYPLLDAPTTRVDAALARVSPGSVDPAGAILELGTRQADNTLAAAPPGISSTAGRGEQPRLGMTVAKSGRTTGLTCGSITALDTEILVDYYRDCAETEHAFRKRFTGQMVASGNHFADAGDSGSLVVDGATAEPVGLFFAGGVDNTGVEQAIANPVGDVLGDLAHALGAGALHFVGAADHPVACLRYPAPQAAPAELSATVRAAAAHALELARQWAATTRSAGSSAADAAQPELVASLDQVASDGSPRPAIRISGPVAAAAPRTFAGVPTQVAAAAAGPNAAGPNAVGPNAAGLAAAERVRDSHSAALFALSPAFFGLGVGQSADNPADPALILFVDRSQPLPALPTSVGGQRLRVIRMERPHVTRGHGQPAVHGCRPPLAGLRRARQISGSQLRGLPLRGLPLRSLPLP